MTATTGVVAPSEAMFNVMMKELPSCVSESILERMKEYGDALLDAAGAKYGFDAEEASSSLISNNESKDKIELDFTYHYIQHTQAMAVMQTSKITENERELYIKQKSKAKFGTVEEEYEYAEKNIKKCSKCNSMKKLSEYSGNTSGCDAFDRNGYRLRRPECKDCNKTATKGKTDAIKLAKSLGIPHKAPEDTKCALCGNLPKKGDELVFDHCHKTNTFRGYLHNSCNRSLGVLGDDVPGLMRSINFLNKYEKKNITQNKDTGSLEIIED
jgi:hypothetical protein